MSMMNDAAKRAEWVYGQPMAPCPKCGSYNMKPQIPIALETTGDETLPQLVGKRNKQIARAAAILGALGGASRSPAKAMASRANGKRGGRPRKTATPANKESLQLP